MWLTTFLPRSGQWTWARAAYLGTGCLEQGGLNPPGNSISSSVLERNDLTQAGLHTAGLCNRYSASEMTSYHLNTKDRGHAARMTWGWTLTAAPERRGQSSRWASFPGPGTRNEGFLRVGGAFTDWENVPKCSKVNLKESRIRCIKIV